MIHLRIFVWCLFWGAIAYLICIGPLLWAIGLAILGLAMLALAEGDELRDWWRQRRHDEMLADSVATRMKGSLRGSD